MSINPNDITTVRVDQLPNEPASLSSLLPHQVGTELKHTLVSDFITFIASAIGSGFGVGFLPVSVTDGQTLPPVPENPSFILVGAGTYVNLDGFPNIVCTENLNALITVGTHWELSVEIPITPLTGSVQSVTGSAVDNSDPLNPVINLNGGGSIINPDVIVLTFASNPLTVPNSAKIWDVVNLNNLSKIITVTINSPTTISIDNTEVDDTIKILTY